MKRVIVLIGLVYLGLLLGCGGGSSNSGGNPQPPVLKSITVSPSTPSVTIDAIASDANQQFTATGSYNDGSSKDLTSSASWSSSDTGVATITAAGLVTGIKGGSATITATSGGVSGTATVNVTAALKSIAITTATPSIAPGTQAQFTAMGTYFDKSTKNLTSQVTWNSSVAGVASISNTAPTNGLAQAISAGTSMISATSGSILSNSAALTVTNAKPVLLQVTPNTVTVGLGVQQQFAASGTFDDGTKQDITNVSTWSSSPSGIAFVATNSGLAVAKSVGITTITATFAPPGSSVSGTATLTVNLSNLTAISVRPAAASIANGTSLQYTAVGTFSDGSTRSLGSLATWSSSVTTVATIVPTNGLATSQGMGMTTITASAGGLSGSTTLNVTLATLQSISVAPANVSIAPNTKLSLTATGKFSDNTTQDLTNQVTWFSSVPAVATMNGNRATGQAAGTTTITATSSAFLGSIVGSAPLTVTSGSLVSIAVKPADNFIPPGGTLQYSAIGTFSDGSTQDISQAVTWSSSVSGVATITSFGLASGQGQGKTIISAQLSGSTVTGTTSLLVTPSALVKITITPSTSKLAFDTLEQLTATGTFGDGSTQNLTTSVNWTSSSSSVATIGAQSGIITGMNPGQTNVTAVFNGIVGNATVNVTNATLTSITISPSSASIPMGGSQAFTAVGAFSDGSTQSMTLFANWTSSDPQIAVITSFGFATTTGPAGTTNITAPFTQNGVTVPSNAAILTVH